MKQLLNNLLYGVPSEPAKHIDWTVDTEPFKKLKVRTVDEYPNLTPFEREAALYKEKLKICK